MKRTHLGKSTGVACAFSALAILFGAADASAAVTTDTVSGTVGLVSYPNNVMFPNPPPETDTLGEFGSAGANLSGDTFTLTFRANDSQATYLYSNPDYDLFEGPITARLTINDQTFTIHGNSSSQLVALSGASNGASFYLYNANATSTVPFSPGISLNETLSFFIYLPVQIPSAANYHSFPFSGVTWYYTPFDYVNGFQFQAIFEIQPSSSAISPEFVELVPNTLTVVDPPGGVPEPATWAMLILGVTMIGFAARRRRDATAVVA